MNMPKLGVIIQARSGSVRLPGKVLMQIRGESIIQRIYRLSSEVYPSVVAIPFGDSPLAMHLSDKSIPFFCGHETDVLGRYLECAKEEKLTHVIRVTGDCPMISQETLFWMGEHGLSDDYDFYSNCGTGRKSVDGEDCEFMSLAFLRWMSGTAQGSRHREHVTQYVYDRRAWIPEEFKIGFWLDTGLDMSAGKSSIDTKDEFDRIKKECEK